MRATHAKSKISINFIKLKLFIENGSRSIAGLEWGAPPPVARRGFIHRTEGAGGGATKHHSHTLSRGPLNDGL